MKVTVKETNNNVVFDKGDIVRTNDDQLYIIVNITKKYGIETFDLLCLSKECFLETSTGIAENQLTKFRGKITLEQE